MRPLIRGPHRGLRCEKLFHLTIELTGDIGDFCQVLRQSGGDVAIVLVEDLVFKACPEIHSDGPDLKLDNDGNGAGRQEHGNFDDHTEALVAVGLGVADEVLDLDDANVVL